MGYKPRIRFKGFTEDWEQREFSDIFAEVKSGLSRMLSNDDIGLPVVRANNINDGQLNLFDDIKYWYKNDPQGANTNNYLIEQGDILINFINSEAKMGTAAYVTRRPERDTIYTTNILRCKVNDEYNPYFIYSLTFLNSYKNYIASITKPAVNQASFTTVDFKKYSIKIPTVKEQNQIANLIEIFNKFITLHQCKLEKLKLTKKALLQKLFPKNGKHIPEIRFKGFTDAWEQRKLGECMNSFAYGLNAAAKDYDGMHKYIRITDIDDETHNFIQSNLTSPDIDFNMDVSDYKLNVGDIVFARTGASVGKTYLYNPNDGDLYYAGFLIRGEVKEDCDAGFIYQNTLTKEYDSFIRITSQRSGQPGVNSKEYATFKLNIPCKDEQEKISKVLNSLDELYTLHQRKLERLQEVKKGLLQKMFV